MILFALSAVLVPLCAWMARVALGRWPRPGVKWGRPLVAALTVLAAALALPASAAPTGNAFLDPLYRALFAAAVTWAAARARRWAWLVATGAVLIGDQGGLAGLVVGSALGLALGSSRASRPGRVAGAAIGVAVAEGALRMHGDHPLGTSAALAAVAAGVLGLSYLHQTRSRVRRRCLVGAAALGGLAALSLLLYGLGAWSVRHDARRGLAEAQAALSAAHSGRAIESSAHLQAARADLTAVRIRTDAWWDRPVLAIPVAAQNARAVRVVTAQAEVVLGRTRQLLLAASARDLQMSHGRIDLARIQQLAPAVSSAHRALVQAQGALAGLRSPWLVAPLAHRLGQLRTKIATTSSAEATLGQATQVLPGLLGAGGSRRWLLVILDNSELRGGGGLIADVGIVTASGGHLALSSLQVTPVSAQAPETIRGQPDYMARYGWLYPEGYMIDDAHSPDFPTDGAVLSQVYAGLTGESVDGVIGVDAFGLASLLQVTGPVSLPAWPVPVSAANAATVILHDQYLALNGSARSQFLIDLGHAVFSHLTAGTLPGPAALASVLGPAAAGHHIQLYSPHPVEERLFDRIRSSGRMAPVRDDFLEVVTQNFSLDKGDWYLTRKSNYSVTVDPDTGSATATLSVHLHNSVNPLGQPPYVVGGWPSNPTGVDPPGYNKQWVSIYSPLALADASVGGHSVALTRQRELHRNVYSAFVVVPPGGNVTLVAHLYGAVQPGGRYRLDVGYQAAPQPDWLDVRMLFRVGRGRPFLSRRWTMEQSQPLTLSP